MDYPTKTFTVTSPSTDTTLALGQTLGALLTAEDIVGLVGKLGAGKTWFAKGVAYGLGVDRHEYVNSPAYDIVHEYAGRVPVFHMDLYRIDVIGEDEYLWLDEYLDRGGVCIVEWADKFLNRIAESFLTVNIDWDILTDVRTFTFEGTGDHYGALVDTLRKKYDASA
jgi:tRNA threonylcarbamoyladenosine biosynthesis protein TsaE